MAQVFFYARWTCSSPKKQVEKFDGKKKAKGPLANQ